MSTSTTSTKTRFFHIRRLLLVPSPSERVSVRGCCQGLWGPSPRPLPEGEGEGPGTGSILSTGSHGKIRHSPAPNWRGNCGAHACVRAVLVRANARIHAREHARALVRHPGQSPDLAELAPGLAPGIAGILAHEYLPIVATRQHQVRIGSVHSESPDGRVGLHGEMQGLPGLTAVLGALYTAGLARCGVTVGHEQHVGIIGLHGDAPAVWHGERVLYPQGLPALALVGAGENLPWCTDEDRRGSPTADRNAVDVRIIELFHDFARRHCSAGGFPGLATVQTAAYAVHFRTGPHRPVVVRVYRHRKLLWEAYVGALVGKLGLEVLPRLPTIARAKDRAWACPCEDGIGLHRVKRHRPDGLAAEGRGDGLESNPTIIAAVDAVVRTREDHIGVLWVGGE